VDKQERQDVSERARELEREKLLFGEKLNIGIRRRRRREGRREGGEGGRRGF
jgi:hypothetical protein